MRSMIRLALALAFTALIAGAIPTFDYSASAHPRISTGQELYDACKVLTEHALNNDSQMPRRGMYCQQFIAGYFMSMKYSQRGDEAKMALGTPVGSEDCVALIGSQSYAQLAGQVLRNAEWTPALLGKPAIELARAAFGAKRFC